MPAGAVCAGDELPFAQRLVRDDAAGESDRAERTALRAEAGCDLIACCRSKVGAQRRLQLRLLEAVIAAQEREHERAVVLDDRHRLRGRCEIDREQLGERLARAGIRGLDLLR